MPDEISTPIAEIINGKRIVSFTFSHTNIKRRIILTPCESLDVAERIAGLKTDKSEQFFSTIETTHSFAFNSRGLAVCNHWIDFPNRNAFCESLRQAAEQATTYAGATINNGRDWKIVCRGCSAREGESSKDYENRIGNLLREAGHYVLTNVHIPPPFWRNRNQEQTFSYQADHLLWDGDGWWVVECKMRRVEFRNGAPWVEWEGAWSNLWQDAAANGKYPRESIIKKLRALESVYPEISLKGALLYCSTLSGEAPGSIDLKFRPKTSPNCKYNNLLRGACEWSTALKENGAIPAHPDIKDKITYCLFTREHRTRLLCKEYGHDNIFAKGVEISGVAGAGKSFLLIYYAISRILGRRFDKEGTFKDDKIDVDEANILITAKTDTQVTVLKSIAEAIINWRDFASDDERALLIANVPKNIQRFDPQNEQHTDNRALYIFLDEAQDLDENEIKKILERNPKKIVWACDRLQRIRGHDSLALLKAWAETKESNESGYLPKPLKTQFRTPAQVYLAALDMLYRLSAASGAQYARPAGGATETLEALCLTKERSKIWFKERNGYYKTYNCSADTNALLNIGLRCDIHPINSCRSGTISCSEPDGFDNRNPSWIKTIDLEKDEEDDWKGGEWPVVILKNLDLASSDPVKLRKNYTAATRSSAFLVLDKSVPGNLPKPESPLNANEPGIFWTLSYSLRPDDLQDMSLSGGQQEISPNNSTR